MTSIELASQLRSYMSKAAFLVARRRRQRQDLSTRFFSPPELKRMTDDEVIMVAISGGNGRGIQTLQDAKVLADKCPTLRDWIECLAVYAEEDDGPDSMESMLDAAAHRRNTRILRSPRE